VSRPGNSGQPTVQPAMAVVTATLDSSAQAGCAGSSGVLFWPRGDLFRMLSLLQAQSVVSLRTVCKALRKQYEAAATTMCKARGDPATYMPELELQQVLVSLELATAEAAQVGAGTAWNGACQKLLTLEGTLQTECRYCYGPDWDVKPGKLVSRKGTWLKTSTCFSWDLNDQQKLYLPQGVVMPILQIGKVTDSSEIKRHEWVSQHVRVWMKPSIVRTLEARRGVWFVYWPHFEDQGLVIVPQVDTWLKRTTQMSGEVEPFELIYLPKGLPIQLASEPALVDEEWEKCRHQHVHLHRKVLLASPPLTVKQDKYDIFVGQREDNRPPPALGGGLR